MIDSAKAWYLGDKDYPLEDRRVREWLAGTFRLTPELAQHLADLTHGDTQWWLDKDAVFGDGPVPPATAVYEVRILQEWEASFTAGLFMREEDAEAYMDTCRADKEREIAEEGYDDGRFPSLYRSALWLPTPEAPSGPQDTHDRTECQSAAQAPSPEEEA
jgi:hypothetical protein